MPKKILSSTEEETDFFSGSERSTTDIERNILHRNFSVDEFENSLKKMQKGKAPGCEGIPPEFYLRFWHILGKYLSEGLMDPLDKGILSPNQRRQVITLIPKKGIDKRFLKNWRPISVLNADYKILSKALATRLAGILPRLTNSNQTGFVSTRYIADNVLNLQSMIDFLQLSWEEGLLVALDFKAAFDSIDHDYIFRTLRSYNLADNYTNWVETLYHSAEASVVSDGFSTGSSPVKRGVRQGCPLSPLIFVMAVKKMADAIRNCELIRGIDILDTNLKIFQFADDSTLILRDEASLDKSWEILSQFRSVSGMELNTAKTNGQLSQLSP